MKRTMKLTALLAALALVATACEKPENPVNGNPGTDGVKERTIVYTVGDNENRKTLTTDAEWDAVLDQFCDQAQSGSEVIFYNMNQTTYFVTETKGASKENRTISTTSRDEMKKWMKNMEKQGKERGEICETLKEKFGEKNPDVKVQ